MRTAAAIFAILLHAGCTPPSRPPPLDPLPIDQAVETINDNNRRIVGVLKAEGRVIARVRTSGDRVRTFDLEGILIYAPTDHLRFTLKHDLAGDQLIVGANSEKYWFHDLTAEEPPKVRSLDRLVNGRDREFPVQPRQIIEAIGLSPLPVGAELHPMRRPVQRVESEDQQLLFLDYDGTGAPRLEKEYWLARSDPRLVRRIVFRDGMGRIEMESQLSQHQPLGDIGPRVPFHIVVDWPLEGSRIEFSVSKWQMMMDKGKDLPAFQPPAVGQVSDAGGAGL
ncbi:MAG: hypothetical protein IT449_10090 [Phycisphaerales bacterium]|nr:hypothetical protein [Phycisphaerales bacterium]